MSNMINELRIGILGFGHMGRSIFSLLKNQSPAFGDVRFFICSLGIKRVRDAVIVKRKDDLLQNSDFVFLCVKPQEFYQMNFAENLFENDPILISIMAGVNSKNIKKITCCRKIVRAMPNLPLQIGKGVTGYYADKKIFNKNEWKLIENIFSNFGKSFFVSSEKKLDVITAISGSGPAYVFLFLDALIKSAVKLGLDKNQAEEMVVATVLGSAEYFSRVRSETKLAQLISTVKSKKGTTEAALNELNVENFYNKWESAVRKAHERAKQISTYEFK